MALAVVALILVSARFVPSYPRHAYVSGWILFALMLVLTFFNFRKKVPFLRLGSASLWLKMHIFLGVFSGALFFVHIGWTWPSGIFRQIFAWCYLVVFISGLLGWWMSRSFPRRLTLAGYETPYERITNARVALREKAEALILANEEGTSSTLISRFYTEDLGMFFTRPRNFWAHLLESRGPQAAHASRFDELKRYTKKGGLEAHEELRGLVEQKHMLDYQHSLQKALRLWLFIHIPLSYALLIFSVLHVVLVHAYSGAVS